MNFGLFDSVGIVGVYAIVAIAMLFSFEIGYQIGKRTRTHRDGNEPVSLGPMVAGMLGMLAFVLAFTVSMAASNHNLRKQYVLDEVNAIGTAYLRAELLDGSYQTELKRLLREYVDVRLWGAANVDKIEDAVIKSLEIHRLLWGQVSSAARLASNTNTALVLESINGVIDMHEKRFTAGMRNRIPLSIWIALLSISTLTMITMGIQVGLVGKRRLVAVTPLALAFAVLVTVIADLDRPQKGLITVGQNSMVELKKGFDQETK